MSLLLTNLASAKVYREVSAPKTRVKAVVLLTGITGRVGGLVASLRGLSAG